MIEAFAASLWAEVLKARRSRVPLLTAAGFSLVPLVGGLFMFILKDPERARRWGILGTKARLAAGVADWPTLFALLSQATAVGGVLLFALAATWVFGREGVDGTAKDLVAVPTPRETIVAAKFLVVGVWCVGLAALVWAGGLVVGAGVGLPGWSWARAAHAAVEILVVACITVALTSMVSLVASATRGYLAPMGFAILTLFLAQILAVMGWGGVFPWSVAVLYAGLAGPRQDHLHAMSYVIVAVAAAIGMAGTFLWWRFADHR